MCLRPAPWPDRKTRAGPEARPRPATFFRSDRKTLPLRQSSHSVLARVARPAGRETTTSARASASRTTRSTPGKAAKATRSVWMRSRPTWPLVWYWSSPRKMEPQLRVVRVVRALEFLRRQIPQGGVQADAVVERLDVLEDTRLGFRAGGVPL